MIFTIITVVLSVGMLVGAVMAIYLKNTAAAVISAGVVSLLASVIYLVLAAPDVAMTEAAIGSGLSTVIFFYVLNRVKQNESNEKSR